MKFDLFAERLKEAREKQDLSQQDLAYAVGTNKQNISAYEQGRAFPKDKILEKIIGRLGVTKNYLLGVEQKKSEPNRIAELEKENAKLKATVKELEAQIAVIAKAIKK